MLTLMGLRMKTEAMMERIHRDAVAYTLDKFKVADRHYYETSEGGRLVTDLIHELEDKLGVDPAVIIDLDLAIRDEVFGLGKENA